MNKVFIPLSIVVSGLIIAGAIYLSNQQQQGAVGNPGSPESQLELEIAQVDASDHIRGNPDADIIIVEYSDYECPFCKGFHDTMKRVMDEYGTSGKVAWVYRHFPLTQIHPDALPSAYASECVAKVGGNEKFWEFSDLIISGAPESLSEDKLLSAATSIGINENEYKACLASDYPKNEVQKDMDDGNKIAAVDREFGTPYNILISKAGVQTPIKGNQPYTTVKNMIDTILAGGN